MLTSEPYVGSELLTSYARIIKSTEEDDVMLPQRHSGYGSFKKRG